MSDKKNDPKVKRAIELAFYYFCKQHDEALDKGAEALYRLSLSNSELLKLHHYNTDEFWKSRKEDFECLNNTINYLKNVLPKLVKEKEKRLLDYIIAVIYPTKEAAKGFNVLLNEAKTGNDEALFKLIRIFKEVTTHDWVIERIFKAVKEQDSSFFSKFGKAIAASPEKKKGNVALAWWFIDEGREMAENKTDKEITNYLENRGWFYTEEVITKTRQRLGIRKKRK